MRSPLCTALLTACGIWYSPLAAPNAWAQATPPQDTSWTLEKPLVGRALPCEGGKIKIFDCQNVELLSYLPPSALGGAGAFDIWGWTDSTTGREFVMIGGETSTAFVETTDPVNPKYLGTLPIFGTAPLEFPGFPGAVMANRMPAIKVYKHHALIAAEGYADQGMQVFDLTQLRDVKNPPVVFHETAHYDKLGNAHTLIMDEATGFAYPVGGMASTRESCGGGLHMIDVRTPTKPTFAGCYPSGYIHDGSCVVYHGPDQQYKGREICLNAVPEAGIEIVDVTDKQHIKAISTATYPDLGYTHQGWLTEDQRHFFVDDETDPQDKTRTLVFDLDDLDDPVVLTTFYGTTNATAHNLYIRGRYMYQSNYTAGLRIVDIADPKNPKEVGYLDTEPKLDGPGQRLGSWGNYPFLKNEVVAVASNGLFLVRLWAR